jgi:hypothetical protein
MAEQVFGDFNFDTMTKAEVIPILTILKKGFNPEVDSVTRMRIDAFALCKRFGLKTIADVEEYADKQQRDKMGAIREETANLVNDREKLETLLVKAGARPDLRKYRDPEDNWRLCVMLENRLTEKHSGITVAELEALDVSTGEGRGIPCQYDDLESVPVIAPYGVTESALNWFKEENERATARGEAAPKIGRNYGKQPMAEVVRADGTRLYMTMPLAYIYAKQQ